MQRQQGLTLLELLVVMAIIGLAFAAVSLSLRDSSQTQLEREAQRLMAVLEAARAQSRTSGIALIWQPTAQGFVIRPAQATNPALGNGASIASTVAAQNAASPIGARSDKWLVAGTQTLVSAPKPSININVPANWVVLGPEPILAAARITLSVANTNSAKPPSSLSIGTDGLQPFQIVP
jgi:general secretion pathway protein H